MLLYINNFTDPVKKLITFTEQFQNGYGGCDVCWKLWRLPRISRMRWTQREVCDGKGAIDFENVSFAYEGTQEKVLSGVNLKVKAGE